MTTAQKETITQHLLSYLDLHGLSMNEFAKLSKVPSNYLSQIKNEKHFIPVEGKEVAIQDKYFKMIAMATGFEFTKNHWQTLATPQMLEIINTLQDAKDFGYTNIIIGETGSGKTYISDLFVSQNPREHYKVTVGSMDNIADLLDKICEALKIPSQYGKSKKINEIIKVLKDKKMNNQKPILIFDEAEYMKQATLCNMKELHDHLNKFCGLVMIGTNQLESKLDRLRKKNRDGIPQFYRRIKFGIRRLKGIDTHFKDFLKAFEITDKALINFLQKECDNYGELHDVLVPSLREAERMGEALSLSLVQKVLNLS
jgi:DNA transposition AAA+ family ATPase